MAADESLIIVSGRLLRSQFISLNTFHQTENYTKIKGGRRTTKARKDCPCKQVFSSTNTSSSPVPRLLLLAPSAINCGPHPPQPPAPHPSRLYLCFPRLLIVSVPCYCLPLLSINLSNKLGSGDRCVKRSPLLSHSCVSDGCSDHLPPPSPSSSGCH